MVAGTTFGTLLSVNRGQSWSWLCDDSVGYDDNTEDPTYVITNSDTLLAATVHGLSISRDSGCSWSLAGAALAGAWITDLAQASDGSIWLTTAVFDRPSGVFVSHDDAKSFQAAGPADDGVVWLSLRIAGPIMYVSGLRAPAVQGDPAQAVLHVSHDSGQTWVERTTPAPSSTDPTALRLLWVAGDVVFTRTTRDNQNVLHVSHDGGQTWQEALAVDEAEITSVIALPEPGHFLAGTRFSGVYRSSDDGMTFTLQPSPSRLACAASHPADGMLYGCADDREDSMALGRSADGMTWSSVLTWAKIGQPLACPAASPQAESCEPRWPVVAGTLGIAIDNDPGDPGASDKDSGCGGGSAAMLLFLPILPWWRSRRRADL